MIKQFSSRTARTPRVVHHFLTTGLWLLPVLAGLSAVAQTPLDFEVATLKASPPPAGDLININLGNIRNGRLTFENASLSDLLKLAYGIVSDAQLKGPDWIKLKSVRIDILAQIPSNVSPAQVPLMLQNLLAHRLQVRIHHERKVESYLALVRGKNRPQLLEVTPDPAGPPVSRAMLGRILGSQMTMARLDSRASHTGSLGHRRSSGPGRRYGPFAIYSCAGPTRSPTAVPQGADRYPGRRTSREDPIGKLIHTAIWNVQSHTRHTVVFSIWKGQNVEKKSSLRNRGFL